MSLITCKSCGEMWDFEEMSNDSVLDCFDDEDWRQLQLWSDWYLVSDDLIMKILRGFLVAKINNGGGCFSCGFDPIYKKMAACQVVQAKDVIVNFGKVKATCGEAPDPHVGIFNGWITYINENDEELTFGWDDEVIILR